MLYILRHGKTDWNAVYRLQGRTDIPLNDEGREMARQAKKQYAGIHFDICFSSPLIRALETAQIFLEGTGVPICTDDRLAEMSFGPCEGVQNVFGKPNCPAYKLFKDPVNYIAPEGAESFEALFARTGAFLEEIKPRLDRGEDILIVGHGAMLRAIAGRCQGTALADFWTGLLNNCQLVRLL